jgi:hypothetical protein
MLFCYGQYCCYVAFRTLDQYIEYMPSKRLRIQSKSEKSRGQQTVETIDMKLYLVSESAKKVGGVCSFMLARGIISLSVSLMYR